MEVDLSYPDYSPYGSDDQIYSSTSLAPLFDPYHPSLPYHLDSRPDKDISNTIEIVVRLIDSNTTAIDRVVATLERVAGLLQPAAAHLPEVSLHLREVVLALREISDTMGKTMKRAPFQHPHPMGREQHDLPNSMPTSAIANAKDRELPSFSSKTTQHSDSSSADSQRRAEVDVVAPLADVVASVPEVPHVAADLDDDDHLEPLGFILPEEVAEAASPSPASPPVAQAETEPIARSPAASPEADVELAAIVSAESEVEIPVCRSSNAEVEIRSSPVGVSAEGVDPVTQRRSTRQKRTSSLASIDTAPSASLCAMGKSSSRSSQARPNRRRAANVAPAPSRNEPIQLKRSDGIVRVEGAVWPKKQENTLRGTAIFADVLKTEVTCMKCAGRCHLCCAGRSPDEVYPEDWLCPDCAHIATACDALEQTKSDTCIRKDCILRAKQKRKYEPGDEEQWSFDRIIGRRPAPGYQPGNRVFEYLFRWNGINTATGEMWGVEDSTWEPARNLPKKATDEANFFQACVAEQLDARPNNDRVLLLAEAQTKWDGNGNLQGDGWSKQVMALVAAAQDRKAEA